MEAVQFRIARPTDQLKEVIKFYKEALGLVELGSFQGHTGGYDGVMLGLPNAQYHLEFTQHSEGSPCPAPTKDNLLVFYYDEPAKYERAVTRIEAYGAEAVEAENSYWDAAGKTYEDPDGWRVVLFNRTYNPQ